MIGTDGKAHPQNTTNTPGIFPLAVSVSGSYPFVADTYQPLPDLLQPTSPCSGSIAVYPILTGSQAGSQPPDTLGSAVANTSISANYWPLTLPAKPTDVLTPTGLAAASSGAYVYVTAFDATTGGGYIFGFAVNTDGTLSATNQGVPFAAARIRQRSPVRPTAVLSTSRIRPPIRF